MSGAEGARAMGTRRDWDLPWWAPLVVFALAPLLVFPTSMLRAGLLDGGDDALSNLPNLLYSARKLLAGDILWAPELWLGTPMLPEPEFATFYLPRLFLPFLPPTTGFALYVLLHYTAAEASFFAYVRALGCSRLAAVFGALAYAFSGFMLGHRGHTMYLSAGALAPLFLLCVHRATAGASRWVYVAAAVTYAAVVFSGAVQLATYLGVMALALGALLSRATRSARPLATAALAVGTGLLVAAVQIVPSIAFVHGLVSAPRQTLELAAQYSWSPWLLPTLALPLVPIEPELYSRVGTVVLLAAAYAIAGPPRRSTVARAYALIALAALVLMLGRYVPILPALLRSLPIVDVFRGPARHNFELGLAVSVLAALGLDGVLLRGRQSLRPWLAGCFVAAGCGAALVVAVRRFGLGDAEARKIFADVSLAVVVPVGVVALGWLAMVSLAHTRGARWAVLLIVPVPILEAHLAASEHVFRDFPALFARAALREERGGFARVLAPHLADAQVDALAGNAVLVLDGVQQLNGYASMAHRDSAALFDLDMHGQALDPADLAWSRLPSVFGLTHVVLPEVVCGHDRFALDGRAPGRDAACSVGRVPSPFELGATSLSCDHRLASAVRRYRLRAEARAEHASPQGVAFGMYAKPPRTAAEDLAVPGERLGTSFAEHARAVELGALPRVVQLAAFTDGDAPVEVRGARLTAEKLRAGDEVAPSTEDVIATLDPGPGVYLNGASYDGETLRLRGPGFAEADLALPYRPVAVRIDAEPLGAAGRSLGYGLAPHAPGSAPQLMGATLDGRTRVTRTFALPADASVLELRLASADAQPVAIHEAIAEDACLVRRYERVRGLSSGLALYRNLDAFARVYAVGDVTTVEGAASVRRKLRDSAEHDPARTAIVETDPRLGAALRAGTIERADFASTRVDVDVAADGGPTFVVVNDRFDPGWSASIDGAPAPIFRTNGLVRGVVVPEGRHHVAMRYRAPDSIRWGALLSLVGLALAAFAAPAIDRRLRPTRPVG